MLLTLPVIKQQCRINPDDDSRDALLTVYGDSAKKTIENKTGRKLFALKADIPAENGWYASIDDCPDLMLAMLLLVTHYNDNPSATTESTTRTLPFSVKDLVSPYIVCDPSILPDV
jgi:uncharacterized phage protein (predicted DNA packaging)